MNIYAGKDWIVICCDNVTGGYDRVEGSIGKSYDEIKGVTMSMSRDFTCSVRLQLARRSKNWIV